MPTIFGNAYDSAPFPQLQRDGMLMRTLILTALVVLSTLGLAAQETTEATSTLC